MKKIPVALTIAGSDSSGGVGIDHAIKHGLDIGQGEKPVNHMIWSKNIEQFPDYLQTIARTLPLYYLH